jgi:hypothetical protein
MKQKLTKKELARMEKSGLVKFNKGKWMFILPSGDNYGPNYHIKTKKKRTIQTYPFIR